MTKKIFRVSSVDAVLAQLVEQRTENPCVPGSIPGDGTRLLSLCEELFFLL